MRVSSSRTTSVRSNGWTADAVVGPNTSLARRADGSWAGVCNGGTLELRPAADGALEGQQVRSGVSAPVRLAVTTPESDSQNVLTVEGQVLQPQLSLAHHCLY